MHWLSTASAWYALSCLLIIAMYILKKRYEPKSISSHLLWRRALQEQEANKPWQRLKQRLLLWLQLITAILIVLALMEPVIEKKLTEKNHVVILLDRSSSMATSTLASGDSYLQSAKQELIDWLDDELVGGEVTLVTNGDYPTIVLNHAKRKAEIEQAIKNITPYYGVSDDEAAMSLARALAEQDEQSYVHYFVDERYKVSEQTLQNTSTINETWHLYSSSAHQFDNSIRSFTLTKTGERVSAFVTVLHAPAPSNSQLKVEVTAYDEKGKVIYQDELQKQAEIGGLTTFQFDGLPSAYYYYSKLVSQDNDPNVYNNEQFGLIAEQNSYEALLISQGNLFLEKALQLMNVGITKITAEANPPSGETLKKIQFIIVDGNYDSLKQQTEWSELFSNFPIWVIDHPDGSEAAQLVNKAPVVNEHPITNYFSMEDTYISTVRKLSTAELSNVDVLVEYGGSPVIVAGINEQKPFLRFAFALQDSDLPLRATFPILMMQSIEYMASGSGSQLGFLLVGSEPTISLMAGTSSSYWQQIATKGEHKLASSEKIMNESNLRIVAPAFPGVYELVEENEQGEQLQRRTAIVSEDSTDFIAEKITALLPSSNEQADQTVANVATSGWSSLVPWLAALLLLLVFAEWEVYRRGL